MGDKQYIFITVGYIITWDFFFREFEIFQRGSGGAGMLTRQHYTTNSLAVCGASINCKFWRPIFISICMGTARL